MNSFSRAVLCTALLFAAIPAAHALNVHAVYRTACTREVGVILKVEKRDLQILRLDGTIKKIPRHEVVSLAYYPVSRLPLSQLPSNPKVPAIRVETLYRDELVDLVTGWPIDFSETKIAFLLDSGKDLVIEKDSIWSLEVNAKLATPKQSDPGPKLDFVHPQTAGFCAPNADQPGQSRKVFAQQILNDRIVIKRELDRLQEGYEEVLEFAQDQKFYPVPHVYKDRTALGLWVSVLSRYGASKSRSNNFTPMLVDELHLGPFRYQHVFLSGAAPNSALLHNEAQSQIYYRFKAAYFHGSLFIDPNLILVGTKYNWREEDLEDEVLDDRVNEWLAIEFGFDFGPIAIEFYPAVVGQAAIKTPLFFDRKSDHNLWRAGIRFTQRLWRAELIAGLSNEISYKDGQDGSLAGETEWDYQYGRLNIDVEPHPRIVALVSVIYRRLAYDLNAPVGELSYRSTAVSSAIQARYRLSHRFEVGGNAIVEIQSRRGPDGDGPSRRMLPKLGVFTSFSF